MCVITSDERGMMPLGDYGTVWPDDKGYRKSNFVAWALNQKDLLRILPSPINSNALISEFLNYVRSLSSAPPADQPMENLISSFQPDLR
jgi:hypothetical protein